MYYLTTTHKIQGKHNDASVWLMTYTYEEKVHYTINTIHKTDDYPAGESRSSAVLTSGKHPVTISDN